MASKSMRTLVAFTVFLCLMLVFGASASLFADKEDILEGRILKIGSDAPVFQTKDIDGGDFRLSDHTGKRPVILFFWSFFCGPCREEMPVLQSIYEEVGRDKVLFVGVNLDGAKLGKAIEKFMQEQGLDFTTVFDEMDGLEYKIADPYGVAGTPTVYAIDREGKISFSTVGRVVPEELKAVLLRSLSEN